LLAVSSVTRRSGSKGKQCPRATAHRGAPGEANRRGSIFETIHSSEFLTNSWTQYKPIYNIVFFARLSFTGLRMQRFRRKNYWYDGLRSEFGHQHFYCFRLHWLIDWL